MSVSRKKHFYHFVRMHTAGVDSLKLYRARPVPSGKAHIAQSMTLTALAFVGKFTHKWYLLTLQ
jgi:hypothetical protein